MLDKTALTLTIIGALNWGSIGIFQCDIGAWLFGGQGKNYGITRLKKSVRQWHGRFFLLFLIKKNFFNRSCQFTPIKGLSKVIPDFSERFHNLSRAFFPTRRINKADSHWNNGKSSPV